MFNARLLNARRLLVGRQKEEEEEVMIRPHNDDNNNNNYDFHISETGLIAVITRVRAKARRS